MFKNIITSIYGEMIFKKTAKLQRLKKQSASAKSRHIFLTRCIHHSILPMSFRTRPVLRTQQGRKITYSYNIQMLKTTCANEKRTYHRLLKETKDIMNELKSILSQNDFGNLVRITEKSREQAFVASSTRLREKFEVLFRGRRASYHNPATPGHSATSQPSKQLVKSAVLNLTQQEISKEKIDLLNLGPKFVPAMEKVPIMDIVTSAEVAASELEYKKHSTDAERLRHEVSNILLKHINFKLPSNLNRDQRNALRDLKDDANLKVVPFDKGTGFVLLKKEDMIAKISEQIGEARVLTKDPTNSLVTKFQQQISKLKKAEKIDMTTFYQMYPSDAIPPRLYGLIKAHKPEKGYPMRTVVSTIGTAFYGTSKFLVDLIQPTLDKNEIRVKNSTSFVNEAKTWSINHDEVQVSYDVVALYPSVPIKKAILAMVDIINSDFEAVTTRTKLTIEDIRALMTLCLSKCYFFWEEQFYEIEDTGPIGLSLMVVIAEGYLQFIERKALQESLRLDCHPKSYRRYVDDSHARFCSTRESESFKEILNQQDECIQYTIEIQNSEAELSFLDLTVMNKGTGSYEFKVFRKKAITNIMIKPSSCVNPSLSTGIFKGFVTRAMRICSSQYLQAELDFLINVFVENGHDVNKLKSIVTAMQPAEATIEPADESSSASESTHTVVVRLPWMPRVGPRLRKAMRKYGVKTVFSSGRNLSDMLCNHKSDLPRNSHPGVYLLECQCKATYIGETKKRVLARIDEHRKDVFKGRYKNSGATEHAEKCAHEFKWGDALTIARETDYRRRKIRESLEIRRAQRSSMTVVNRDHGNVLRSSAWDVLMGRLPNTNDVHLTSDVT